MATERHGPDVAFQDIGGPQSKKEQADMGKVWKVIAAVIVSLGLSVAIVGCGSSTAPTMDKMPGDQMKENKMHNDKMGGDGMKDGKMGSDKMDGIKKGKM
jgi:pentapeptide MXKDX repeat protein